MKHLHFIIILLGGIVMAGCQDQLALRDDAQLTELATKAGADEYTAQTSERYVFPAEKDFKAWGALATLEDRFAACEVPENLLRAMSTDALVRTALNYPLNFIYSAYNNPYSSVDLIIKNSALHRELLSRRDAANVLLRYFEQTAIDTNNDGSVFNKSEHLLSYANEMFFEYFLASECVPGLDVSENRQQLLRIAIRKLAERRADPEHFSDWSLSPLLRISASSENTQTRSYYLWAWETPLGHSLRVFDQDEMSSYEIYTTTLAYAQNYPYAIVHAVASGTYNGNGYVWLVNDPTDTDNVATEDNSWLENYDGYNPLLNQMARFWGNDYYKDCNESDAEMFYYGTIADHSAVPYVGSSTNYISKWGSGPLMEHAPAYCPYSTSDISRYKIRTDSTDADCNVTGPDWVYINESNIYNCDKNIGSFRAVTSVEWSAEAYSGNTSSFSWDATTRSLTCYQAGAYKVIVRGKQNNNVLVYTEKTVICTPN